MRIIWGNICHLFSKSKLRIIDAQPFSNSFEGVHGGGGKPGGLLFFWFYCIFMTWGSPIFVFYLRLGVSICLDHVSIKSLDIDTFKKLVSMIDKIWTLKKIWSWQSRSLDFVSTPRFSPKSLDRDQEIYQDMKLLVNLDSFVSISIKSELILSFFSIKISQFFQIFEPEVPQKSLDNVKISL